MKTPKELFLEDEAAAATWRTISSSKAFEHAIMVACAQVTIMMPSQENLVGIRRFLDLLTTLGDKEEEPAQTPMPKLSPPESLVPANYRERKS